MKRAFTWLLALLLLLPAAAQAEEPSYSITQIREQAEQMGEVWRESIETKWRTVEIDVPVIVPEADKMPVLAFLHVKEEADFSLLPGDNWTQNQKENYQTMGIVSVNRENQLPTAGYSKWKITSDDLYYPLDLSMVFPDYGGKTLGDIQEECLSALELLNQGRQAWDIRHPERVMINTATDPSGKRSEICYVHFDYWPTFEGIPGFHSIGMYLHFDLPIRKDKLQFSGAMLGLGPYGKMSVYYAPMQYKRLTDDIPLAGLDKVMGTLRKEVEEGHIRRILEMRLGYAMVYLTDDPEGYTGASRAIWHVEAWWCTNGKKEMRPEDPDYPSGSHGRMECVRIAIDAQTGEILGISGDAAPKQKKDMTLGDYQGFISWEEVGR